MPNSKRSAVAELIKQRLVSGLHLGLLAEGDRLPSVRELSADIGANPRLVQVAYRQLEKEGLLVIRERSGIFVAPRRKQDEIGPVELIVDTLATALQHGIAPTQFPDVLRRSLSGSSRRALVVECNADQIFSIAGELRQVFGMDVQTVDLEASSSPLENHAADVRSADVLVTTTFHAAGVQQLSERFGVPAIVVTMCTDLFAGVRHRLEREPVYFVVTDPRFAAKLQRMFATTRGAANLHVLVNGRDDLSQIPPRAPVYVTRITRKALGNIPLLERLLPEPHVFSPDSGREILSFIVQTNQPSRGNALAQK